jgi:hypothetical protein
MCMSFSSGCSRHRSMVRSCRTASPFVLRAKLDVDHSTKQKVSPLSFRHRSPYSVSDLISLLGNLAMRATASPQLYSLSRSQFTSPPHKLSPTPASYGRGFAIRAPTIASKAAISQRKANSPSHQHRRHHHHHNHHQSPCRAIPPTSWALSSCGYASVSPQPYFSKLSSAIRSLPPSPTTTSSHKWCYHHRCGHSTSRRIESQ